MTQTSTQQKKSSTSFGDKILKWLSDYAEDMLIISGFGFIVWASFLISRIVGFYVLGAVLIAMGYFLARSPTRGDR